MGVNPQGEESSGAPPESPNMPPPPLVGGLLEAKREGLPFGVREVEGGEALSSPKRDILARLIARLSLRSDLMGIRRVVGLQWECGRRWMNGGATIKKADLPFEDPGP